MTHGSGNYTPLQCNTLDGLSEMAGCLYLDLCDLYRAHESQANERRAFLEACRFEDQAARTIDYIMDNNPVWTLNAEVKSQLSQFFATRWLHNFIP